MWCDAGYPPKKPSSMTSALNSTMDKYLKQWVGQIERNMFYK